MFNASTHSASSASSSCQGSGPVFEASFVGLPPREAEHDPYSGSFKDGQYGEFLVRLDADDNGCRHGVCLDPAQVFPKFMRVIDYIRQGYLPTRACREAETSWTSMKQAMKTHPDLADMFEERCWSAATRCSKSLWRSTRRLPAHALRRRTPKMAAVISKNIMWVLEKMWPEKFVRRLHASRPAAAASDRRGVADGADGDGPVAATQGSALMPLNC